jgi:hypothetical protein
VTPSSKPLRSQRGRTAFGRNQENGSHKATKITKKSATEIVSGLCGLVASCENQVFVLQGFASSQNLRRKTGFARVVVRIFACFAWFVVEKQSSVAGSRFKSSVRIFRGRMLIFMQHTGFVKRLFMKVGCRRWRPAETVINNERHYSHEWNGNSMVSLRDSFKFEGSGEVSSFQFGVSSVGSERSDRACSGFKLHTSNSPLPARAGGVTCKTKPNLGILGHVGKGCRLGRGSAGE